jgi:hypothetical protein
VLCGATRRRSAESAGYRFGSALGRLVMRPKARPVRLGGPQVRAPGVVGAIANACERIAPSPWQRGERIRSISGPAPSFERSGSGSVVAISGILGVGLDLPFARSLLRAVVGTLEGELLLAGFGLITLLSPGALSDPLHTTGALLSLTSPFVRLALLPLIGPILTDLALGGVAVSLMLLAQSRRRPTPIDTGSGLPASAPPRAPIVVPALPHRLIAAG